MMKDPGMKQLVEAQQKAMLDLNYASLFEYLTSKGQDVTELKRLMTERQLAIMEAGLKTLESGSLTNAMAQGSDVIQLTSEYDAKIRALLSDEDYEMYQQYEQTQPERIQVNMYKQSLSFDDALSPEQEHQLILSMHGIRTNTTFSSTPDLSEADIFKPEIMQAQLTEMRQLSSQYVSRAQTVLTPAQWEQFKKHQEQQISMQEMALKMAQQMFNPAPPASP
jgi:hypothetical protein